MGFAEASRCETGTDSGTPKGTMYHIASKAWFTAGGKPQPLSFKFEGDDGSMQYVSDILVKSAEDKFYSGVQSREYDCEAIMGGLIRQFRLIFYPEAYVWVMMV